MDVIDLLLGAEPKKFPEKEFKVKSLSKETGGDVVFELRALPFSSVAELRSRGETMPVYIVLAGTVAPNLKNQALLDKYGAITPADLLEKMLLPGEIEDLSAEIEKLSGYKTNTIEEVKKK